MAFTTHGITGTLEPLLGVDWASARDVRLTLEASEALTPDVVGGGVRALHEVVVPVAADGTVDLAGVPATVDGAPLYRLHVRARGARDPLVASTGWFELTEDRDLAWIVSNTVTLALTLDAGSAADSPDGLSSWWSAVAKRATRPARAVFFGSSTTAGANATTADKRWVNRFVTALQAAYPSGGAETAVMTFSEGTGAPPTAPGVQGFNGGGSGTNSTDYIQGAVTYFGYLDPDLVVHMIGSNDSVPGAYYQTPAEYESNLRAVIASINPKRSHLLLHTYRRASAGVTPTEWATYGAVLARIARDTPNVAFVDLSGVYEPQLASDPLDLIDTDTIHMTDTGHELMAEALLRAFLVPAAVPAAGGGGGASDAEDVAFTPTGGLVATDVQAALVELETEKETPAAAQSKADAAAAASVPKTLVDAKGDLLVGTAADTVGRLAAGSNGALLLPDSTQGTGWRFSTALHLEGAGSPEGAVTAPVGSQYTDTAATRGAISWIKATGSGNTGWKVAYGDTGWRDVTALVEAARWDTTVAANNFAYLRRINDTVHLDVYLKRTGTAGASRAAYETGIYTLPSGFTMPRGSNSFLNATLDSAANYVVAKCATNGLLFQVEDVSGNWTLNTDFAHIKDSFVTSDAWPSSLPGSAV